MVLSSAIVCDIAGSQTIAEVVSFRRLYMVLSSAIVRSRLRSAIIWKQGFRLYMVLSSAIVCDHDRRIADDRRPYCDLRSAIIWKPAFNEISLQTVSLQPAVMLCSCG